MRLGGRNCNRDLMKRVRLVNEVFSTASYFDPDDHMAGNKRSTLTEGASGKQTA